MRDFFIKTTNAFDVIVYINGRIQDICSDTVKIIFKQKKSDTDEQAIIAKDAYSCTVEGSARFILTPEDTDVPARNYFYEIKWMNGSNIYILESGEVRILERVFD